ncbi:hypothetical protein IX51_09270 [uncultured archaeon]|nr:hypothetical protein IX51_09270 [uncultured archaeon]
MADTIFTNAKIFTSFDPIGHVEAMVVRDGRITALGKEGSMRSKAGKDAEVVDLKGRVILPGFIDAHMHLDNFGEYLNEIDLVGVSSITELQAKIRGSHGMMGWVIGHGWDEHRFKEHRMPTRMDIEEIEKERPVYLSRVDLHSAVLNTKAIDMLELKDRFHRSGDLEMSEGELTGVVREKAFEYVDRAIKEKCEEDQSCTMLIDALNEAARLGVTTVGFVSCSLGSLKFLERMRREGSLNVRVRAYLNADELDNFKGFENDDMLRVVGVKIFADGSLGTKTALLSFSYRDDPDNRGIEITGQAKMLELARKAEEKGLHIATHAIGDKALDNVIEVYRKLKGKHRIEHASLIRQDQMDELELISPMLVVQPHFIITDFWTLDRIGRSRAKMAYPFRTLLSRGLDMALSTDSPVEPLNPWETVYAAATRGRSEGTLLGQVTDDERLSVSKSIELYTEGSAKAVLDDEIGSLREGNMADFIVVGMDPMTLDFNELRNLKVLETYVKGRKIYSAE